MKQYDVCLSIVKRHYYVLIFEKKKNGDFELGYFNILVCIVIYLI